MRMSVLRTTVNRTLLEQVISDTIKDQFGGFRNISPPKISNMAATSASHVWVTWVQQVSVRKCQDNKNIKQAQFAGPDSSFIDQR